MVDFGEGDAFPDDDESVVDLFVDDDAIDDAAIDGGGHPFALVGVGDGGEAACGVGFEFEGDAEVLSFAGGEGAEGDDVVDGDFGYAAEVFGSAVDVLGEDHFGVVCGFRFQVEGDGGLVACFAAGV